MSSKAKKKRRDFARRERERRITGELKKDWTCECGKKLDGLFPICLCGRFRPEPKLTEETE